MTQKRDVLRILMVEDSPTDAELVQRALRRGELAFLAHRVDNEKEFLDELQTFMPDVVLADYTLPRFDGITALRLVREKSPDTPVIIVSGSLGDEKAVELLRLGATDYVLKD